MAQEEWGRKEKGLNYSTESIDDLICFFKKMC